MAFSINQQTCNQQHKTRRHNGRLSQFYIGPNSTYDVPHFTNAHAVQMLSKLRNVADHVMTSANQSAPFRTFHSADYFLHSAIPHLSSKWNGGAT